MNRNLFFLLTVGVWLLPTAVTSGQDTIDSNSTFNRHIQKKLKTPKNNREFSFNFDEKQLTTIIEELAEELNINVMLPQGQQVIKSTLTLSMDRKLPLKEAWQMLQTICSLAGYIIIEEKEGLYSVKVDNNTNKNIFRLYINTAPETIPNSDEKIRYVHYFSNLHVPTAQQASSDPVGVILKDMLSQFGSVIWESQSNGVIVTDRAANIRSAMTVLNKLDEYGMQEAIEIIHLKHTRSAMVTDLFTKLKASASSNTSYSSSSNYDYGGTSYGSSSSGSSTAPSSINGFFSPKVKIIPDAQANTVTLMGKRDAIERTRTFIKSCIDVPIGTGKSVLHVYDLQYLDAQEFSSVLQNIINANNSGSSQSSVSSQNQPFQNVIIQSESAQAQQSSGSGGYGGGSAPQGVMQGGNKLIIAAINDDWKRIKQLIKELDKPQHQVAVDVLIVDVTLEQEKKLGSQIRNRKGLGLKNANFQFANLSTPVTTAGSPPPVDALMSDLLQLTEGSNLASVATAGSTIISFKDPQTNGIWMISQILSRYANTTILSQPFLLSTNNKNANITDNTARWLPGAGTVQSGGAVSVNFQWVNASLSVNVLPTISASADNINLGVTVNVEEFKSTANDSISRQIQTNANIASGDVLVLGGLIRTRDARNAQPTPLLGKLPIIGSIFQSKRKSVQKDNLLVFISPRLITARKDNTHDWSTEKMQFAKNKIKEGDLFDNLRDPISRWFFGKSSAKAETIDEHAQCSHFNNAQENSIPRKTVLPKSPVTAEINPNQNTPEATIESQKELDQNLETIKELASKADNPFIRSTHRKIHAKS